MYITKEIVTSVVTLFRLQTDKQTYHLRYDKMDKKNCYITEINTTFLSFLGE